MFKKVETMSIKDFMNRGREAVTVTAGEQATFEKGKTAGFSLGLSLLPLAVSPLLKAQETLAAGTEAVTVLAPTDQMYDKMLHAFDPLIMLVQALAYPVAMVVILGGALMVMINQKEKGFGMMQTAGLGYVLVQMTPLVLNILVDAMKAV